MTYDRQILRILTAVGDKGISVQLLAKHVYNQNSTLFYTPDLSEIRLPSSLIESMEQRGYYRLNTKNNPDAQQLMLDFKEQSSEEEKEEKPQQDLSLDLFG